MTKRISLLALTALVAGTSVLGMAQKPASADGLSINLGAPDAFVHFDNYRYQHDREYHDGYDRWHRDHGDRGGDHRDHHDDHRDHHDH
jgi:hypothetical protein